MKYRQWTSKQKSQVVLEGLCGQIDINQLCQKYQISQAQYYKWRDQFLTNCHETFDIKKQSQKEQHLEGQIVKLKRIIGDLTIELKKASTNYETPTLSSNFST